MEIARGSIRLDEIEAGSAMASGMLRDNHLLMGLVVGGTHHHDTIGGIWALRLALAENCMSAMDPREV